MGQVCCGKRPRRRRRRGRIRHSQFTSGSKETEASDEDDAAPATPSNAKTFNAKGIGEVAGAVLVVDSEPQAELHSLHLKHVSTLRSSSTVALGDGFTASRFENKSNRGGHESLAKLVYKMIERNQEIRKKSRNTNSASGPQTLAKRSNASKQKHIIKSGVGRRSGFHFNAEARPAIWSKHPLARPTNDLKFKSKFVSEIDPTAAKTVSTLDNRRFSSMF